MRILISAGIKTENIRRGISKAFANSGDTIDIVNYIDDIDSIFEKGDYFDKALIIDKAITKDGEIKDEFEIRNKINEFSRLMGRRLTADKNREFVFMTEYSDIANMMSEETILINKNSNVVFKKPPYTVKFFVMLLTTSVKSLPDDIVYHPAAITPEGVNKSNGNKLAEKLDIDNSQQAQVHVAPQDLDQAMFGSNDDEVDADKHINDDLGLDTDTDPEQKEADDNSFGSADSGASFDDGDFDTSDDQSTDTSFGAPDDDQVTSDGTQDFGSDQTSNDFGTQDFGTQDFGSDQTSNDFDAPNEQNQGANDGDFDTSDFDTSDNQNQVSDDFGTDQGFDNNSGFETADSNQTVDQNQENEQNDFATDDFGSDQGFDDSNLNFDDTPIEKSGDLPDYVDNTVDQNSQPEEVQQPEMQENNFGMDQDNQVEQTEGNQFNGNVDFDQHAVNDLQNQNYQGNYNNQQYGCQDQQYEQSQQYDQSQQYNNQDQQYSEQQDNMNQQDGQNQYVDNIPGFDNQYDNSQDDPNADIPGFDNDDYANNDDQIQQMQVQQEQPDSLDEFDSSEYQDQNQQNCETPNGMNMNPNGMNMNPNGIGAGLGVEQNNTGKKGFFGRFKSNKQNNQVHQPIQQPVQQQPVQPNRGNINIAQIKNELRPFAERGNSIVVTGCGGCGTSFVAFNLANIIVQLGYTVLLVDFDLKGKTQSYISRTNYEALEPEGNKLISGINSTTGMNQYLTVTKTGFHLLANSLGADSVEVSEVLHKDKLNKFANVAKANHAFVIYDIPFESATTFLQDITYGCDNLVLVTDMSNWGVTKMMTYVTNITSDEMQDIIFSKAQIVFNRYRNMSAAFGKRIRTAADILQEMDNEVIELIGEDPGYHFSDMAITAIINDDPDIEKGWFEDVQYTDTAKGQQVFLNLLRNIVLHKH